MAATNANAINYFSPAKWVVSTVAGEGTHTTIASALTSASSGDTIVIMPGTYTENPTLKAGVNIAAFGTDSSFTSTSQVYIVGKCTFTAAGTVNIYGVQLQTNSDYFLVESGTAASIVNLNNCFLNALNNTGINLTSSGAGATINCYYCNGDVGTTSIGIHANTHGSLNYNYCNITNSGGSTTTSTNSAGSVSLNYSQFAPALACSSTGTISGNNTQFSPPSSTVGIAITGTGTSSFQFCFSNGSAANITVGSGATLYTTGCVLSTSSPPSVSGAGSHFFSLCTPGVNASNFTSATTQAGGLTVGARNGTAPTAGFLGESMYSVIGSSGAVSVVTSNVFVNITSLTLTPGVWDLSCVGVGTQPTTGTAMKWSIATTNTGAGTLGDSAIVVPVTGSSNLTGAIAGYRVTISSNTIYYFNGACVFTVIGSASVFGRFSAVRAG